MGAKLKRIFLIILAAVSTISCTDVLKGALDKAGGYTSAIDPSLVITDFKAQQGDNNREALLTWTPPAGQEPLQVRVVRRTDSYAVSAEDPNAALLYEGTRSRFRDRGLSNDTTYYYAVYVLSGSQYSTEGVFASYSVSDTVLDIRRRSFFLIGGSSSYPAPTANLVLAVDMYDPVTEKLTASVTDLPGPRMYCAVASTGGKIYVIGGKDGLGVSNRVDILDVDTLVWSTGTPITQARCALSAVAYNGRIYCLGGSTAVDSSTSQVTNYIYDIGTNLWTQSAALCADLSAARCAFSAVSFRGMLYYFGGVAAGAWQNSGQYRSLLTNQSAALGNLLYYHGCNYAFYRKELNDGSEVAFFMTFGGSSTTTQTALPAGTLTLGAGTNLVYAAYFPNITGGAPSGYQIIPASSATGIEGFTNRAYSGCEYFGDYIYLFGGISGSPVPAVSNLIERLDVKEGALYSGEWTSTGLGALPAPGRYAFGITRVNY
jgi:hypothetical protein